ncbi:C10 family peptidase [Parabacteroides sp.]
MKRFYLIMAALGLAVGTWAERVDQSTALRVAGQVAKSRTALCSAGVPELRLVYQAPVATGLRSSSASEADYYVFNVGNEQGFVIVSGEDRTHPVLGYAHEGSFQTDRIPVNLSAWLEGYQREIAQLVKSDISASASIRAEWDRYLGGTATNTSSGKVIQTAPWGQAAPFNWMTPKVESGKSTLTCCAATALAIVMRHHGKKNPALTAGKKEFKLAVGETIAEAAEIAEKNPDRLKPFTVNYSGAYDWEAMQDSYVANTYTRESGEAVAKLMWELGASINVRYALDVSSANAIWTIEPLRSIFGYKYASYQRKEWYTWKEWKTIVKNEIDANRPFLLAGTNSQASIGHAFVCDGYDGNSEDGLGLVHINWGLDGQANGFFQLSTLDASEAFDAFQHVVIGLDPKLTELPEELKKVPVGCFKIGSSEQPGVLNVDKEYAWTVELFNCAIEPLEGSFGLCVVNMDEEEIVAEPSHPVSISIGVTDTESLSITLKKRLESDEVVKICYKTEAGQWEPVDTPFGMPFGIDVDGNWIVAEEQEEADDPEISFQADFINNQFTDKYSALNQLALPVSYRITQPDQVVTIRYVVDEESKKLLEGGWVLKGETLSQDGNPLPDSKEITITRGATTLDLPFNSKYFNTTNKVYKQMLTLTFPEEKMESETVKPTGTFKYTVELQDKDCNKLNNEELGGELVLLEKPMAWNLTLENVVEDEAEDRAKSFDAVFTPLSVDDKLKEGNTDLYVSFKSYPGVTVKVTDAGGKDIPVNADFRTDAISEKLTENTTLKLHIELDGNVPGQELFPVIKTAYHNNKQISSKTYALDVYNELEDRYFVVQPKLEDPEYDPDLNGFEEAAFTLTSFTSFTSLDKAGDLIFIFTPEDPEAWDDQVCYFDGKEIKDLIWDCEETMGKKLSFSFSGDGSGQVYQIEEDEGLESSMIDYVIPFRVKAYTEGLLTYSVEIWNPDQDVCVKKIDNQTLRFVKPLEVTSEESKGEINTDVPLKLTVKAEAKTLLMGTKVRPRFTLPAGDLPEGKIALKVDGTEYLFEEVQPEVLCVTLPEITLDAENKLNYTICSSVPLNQALKFALLDAEDREVPMGDKQSDVDVQIYTYYQLIFDLQNVTRDEIKESDDVKIGKDGNLKIRTSIADLSIALQKEGDYELPLAIELLAGDTPVKEGYSYSNDGIITINTIKSDYRLVATGVKTEECVVVYDVESVIHPTLRKVEQTKEAKLFLEAAGGHLLPKAIRIFVKKVSEVQEEAQPAGFLRSEEGETEGAETDVPEGYEELREGTDFTYNATTGQITLTVPDKAKVLMIQAKAEKDPTPPSPTYYSISLPSVEGAMVVADGSTYVEEGSSFSFTIRLDPEYDQSKPVVKANGAVIEPDAEGVYHLSAVYGDVTIEIEGVVKNMPTGTDDAETGQPTAWATEGVLHVYMPAKADLRVYAFQGGLIYAEDAVIGERTIAPGQGVYIIVIGEKRFKLKV